MVVGNLRGNSLLNSPYSYCLGKFCLALSCFRQLILAVWSGWTKLSWTKSSTFIISIYMREVSCPRDSNYLVKMILFPKFQPSRGILSLWIKPYYSLLLPLHRALSHCVLERIWCVHPLGKRRIWKPTKTEDVGHSYRTGDVFTMINAQSPAVTARMGTWRS